MTSCKWCVFIAERSFELDPPAPKEVVVGAGRNPRTIAVYDIKVLAADGIKNIHAQHNRVCTQMTNVVYLLSGSAAFFPDPVALLRAVLKGILFFPLLSLFFACCLRL